MKKALILASSVLLGSVLVGCQNAEETSPMTQTTPAAMQTVSGTMAYRERIALSDNAVVTVTLQDVSLMDAPAKVIATQTFETKGKQVPFAFELAYDSAQIDARHTYSVSARIELNGKLR
ncbi:YbaY family lipoprotein, partial [Vibrio diabolicus]|uniref:YbaY family lipoprotein n=1 Tax=Vibrio diabolicus TaxID=50719 RepID=UPI00211B049A|nr:YbaY family lipoprotein [Vibrio diabolicus]